MAARVATSDAMIAVGIDLHLKLLAHLYQLLGILGGVLEMYVIIGHAMHQQQSAIQLVGTLQA